MTAELLAHNVAAHWMQAGALAVVACLGVAVLRLREPRFLLKYWQAVLLLLLLAPWMQPRQPVAEAPASEPLPSANLELALSGVADLPVAGSAIALPAERWSIDPWTWLLGIAAAGVVVRLAWLAMGLVRLGRLGRSAHRIAPPEPAREFLTRFGLSAAFVQPPEVRMPCSFGLFRPTVVLPAAFGGLEPAFQRAVVCHELVHVGRHDFAGAVLEEVVAALLWFHPWVWLIRRRIRLHREQAVDAAVVRCTGDRRAYVRCLVALAGHPRALGPAAPMLRPTELRARTDALFEKEGTMSKRRTTVLAMGLCAALGVTVWTVAATVPLRAAPVPPDPAAVTVAVGGSLAWGRLEGPAPIPSGPGGAPTGTGGTPAMVGVGRPRARPARVHRVGPATRHRYHLAGRRGGSSGWGPDGAGDAGTPHERDGPPGPDQHLPTRVHPPGRPPPAGQQLGGRAYEHRAAGCRHAGVRGAAGRRGRHGHGHRVRHGQ